ncbi:hypothetical protein SAMN05880582_101195 [Rhizobium sp. RU20A]|uniref:hypothetical protein n=1 Tax=Rhizobium sp. RU20A TaxID=1907412 RepID=UPI000953CFD5|nr:hypothetical protein [Rhizobium sp. RU20A]SIP96580.1 hypothetical protein SAMN05880582_101195 [Rhizobium sp. RU20A]
MALNPALRLMVKNAHEKYGTESDPVVRKRAEILAKQALEEAELSEMERIADEFAKEQQLRQLSVAAQLVALAMQKATKRELRQILVNAMAAEAGAPSRDSAGSA